MGAGLISLFITLGAATWVYTKLQKYSGNNTQQSAIGTAVAAIVIFFISFSLLSLIF